MTMPETKKVKAIDVMPYRWALWCTLGDSKPFANLIVHRQWDSDGKRIVFGLDSHNFYFAAPDAELDLIPADMSTIPADLLARMDARDAKTMAEIPNPPCPACGHVKEVTP